jgi:SAM-dependent methyltransferase
MDYFARIRLRIENEGFLKTIKYIMLVIFYQFLDCICIAWLDCRYSKRLLGGNIKSPYRHLGANDVYHTEYCVMPIIFKLVPVRRDDVLVDIGCGKGRIINYWLSRKLKNKIIGLELDKSIAKNTARQFSRRKNVIIRQGDAIEKLPPDGTVFYFYNPFSKAKVELFEQKLCELFADKAVRIIYYNPISIRAFYNDRWRVRYINFERDLGIKRWGRINKYHDLAIITHVPVKSGYGTPKVQ